jgi:hypothetical protein
MRQTLNSVVGKVLKRLHYPLDVILLCMRWYSAYPLSLRNLEEMMVERGISDLCRSLDRASLGDQIAASAGEAVPALQAQGREELANGRDIQYAQPTEPAYVGVMLLEHVWNAMLH